MYIPMDRQLGTGVVGRHRGIKEFTILLKRRSSKDRVRGSVKANTPSNVKTFC